MSARATAPKNRRCCLIYKPAQSYLFQTFLLLYAKSTHSLSSNKSKSVKTSTIQIPPGRRRTCAPSPQSGAQGNSRKRFRQNSPSVLRQAGLYRLRRLNFYRFIPCTPIEHTNKPQKFLAKPRASPDSTAAKGTKAPRAVCSVILPYNHDAYCFTYSGACAVSILMVNKK